MKRIATLCTVALLVAASARAQFTDPEEAELKKLAQANYDLGSILIRIAELRQFEGEPPVPLATQVKAFAPQAQLHKAIEECGAAVDYFQGLPAGTRDSDDGRYMPSGLTRPQQVAGSFARIDQCVVRLQNALPDLQVLAAADASQAMNVTQVQAMIAGLPTIDRTLRYETPWVSVDAPIVGTHGDLQLALQRHSSIHFYGTGVFGSLIVALREVDGATTTGIALGEPSRSVYDYYYESLDTIGYGFRLHAATWLATLGVVLDDERAIIEADMAAGSGLRPFDFHRLARQSENMGATGAFRKPLLDPDGEGPKVGRQAAVGAGERLYLDLFAVLHFGNVIMADPAADAVELRRRWAVLHNTFFAIDSVWVYIDAVRDSYFLFHHGLPSPPPFCAAPNVCVPSGGGTPPPCPEGQSCMVSSPACADRPELVLLSGTTAEARCVQ